MVKSNEVKVYVDRLYCNKCGAEMEHDGTVLCSYPPQYSHVCPKCGFRIAITTKYPNVRYENIDDNQ